MKQKICLHATDKNKWVWVWNLLQVEDMELVLIHTVLRDKTLFKEWENSKEWTDETQRKYIIPFIN